MSEKFDPIKYTEEINSLVDPALTAYQQVLINAGVPLEDINRTVYEAMVKSTKGLRKARQFAAMIALISTNHQED